MPPVLFRSVRLAAWRGCRPLVFLLTWPRSGSQRQPAKQQGEGPAVHDVLLREKRSDRQSDPGRDTYGHVGCLPHVLCRWREQGLRRERRVQRQRSEKGAWTRTYSGIAEEVRRRR